MIKIWSSLLRRDEVVGAGWARTNFIRRNFEEVFTDQGNLGGRGGR